MGLSFLQIGFLAAGAAAMTLPIWIHLLLRQRARPLEIGSIRFVQQVVRRTKRRQRIQRWLLLALRCLGVLLLGLLFARPYLPETPIDGRTREAAILIDRSASMRIADEDSQVAFDTARQRAQDYVDSLGEQAVVHIALFDAGGVETVEHAALESAQPAWTATGYGEALEWAADLLGDSTRQDRSLLLLGDLQYAAASPLSIAFPADVPVQIGGTAVSVAQNLAIESLQPTQIELRPQVPVTLAVRVFNAGAFPVSNVPVVIEVDGPGGQLREEQTLALDAGDRKTIDVPLAVTEPGLYRGAVSINRDDVLMWDNQRFVAFHAQHPDRVLLVDGEAGRTEFENETYFLETALRLQSAIGDGPARTFEVERVAWDRGVGFPDLAGFRLIVLANIGRCSAADAARLQTFVEAGGNVLMFVGERTTPAILQPLLSTGLLGEISIAPPQDRFLRVSRFDEQHPALKLFADPAQGDLRRLSVKRYLPIERLGPTTQVLIAARDVPLVISHASGKGRFVLVATTADRDWHDWPQSRLFVPLIRQLAAWQTGQLDPRVAVQSEVISDARSQPGIVGRDDTVRVRNVAADESTLQRHSEAEFRELWGLPDAGERAESEEVKRFAPQGVSRSDEKWPLVLWALLAVLAVELILASRIHE